VLKIISSLSDPLREIQRSTAQQDFNDLLLNTGGEVTSLDATNLLDLFVKTANVSILFSRTFIDLHRFHPRVIPTREYYVKRTNTISQCTSCWTQHDALHVSAVHTADLSPTFSWYQIIPLDSSSGTRNFPKDLTTQGSDTLATNQTHTTQTKVTQLWHRCTSQSTEYNDTASLCTSQCPTHNCTITQCMAYCMTGNHNTLLSYSVPCIILTNNSITDLSIIYTK